MPALSSPHQTIIEPPEGWRQIDWSELREYRDLFYLLVRRGIRARNGLQIRSQATLRRSVELWKQPCGTERGAIDWKKSSLIGS